MNDITILSPEETETPARPTLSPEAQAYMQRLEEKAGRSMKRAYDLVLATLDDPEKVSFLKKRMLEIAAHVNADTIYNDPENSKLYDPQKIDLLGPAPASIAQSFGQTYIDAAFSKPVITDFKNRTFDFTMHTSGYTVGTNCKKRSSEPVIVLLAPRVIDAEDENQLTQTCIHEIGHAIFFADEIAEASPRANHVTEDFCDLLADVGLVDLSFEKTWQDEHDAIYNNEIEFSSFLQSGLDFMGGLDDGSEQIKQIKEYLAPGIEQNAKNMVQLRCGTYNDTHPSTLQRIQISAQTIRQLTEMRCENYLSNLYDCTVQFPWHKQAATNTAKLQT